MPSMVMPADRKMSPVRSMVAPVAMAACSSVPFPTLVVNLRSDLLLLLAGFRTVVHAATATRKKRAAESNEINHSSCEGGMCAVPFLSPPVPSLYFQRKSVDAVCR